MDTDLFRFFDKTPQLLPVYRKLEDRITEEFPDVNRKVQKTQITFSNRYNFAFASLPMRRVKGRPDIYMIVTFGLSHHVTSPRIAEAAEPWPNRWTHHVIVEKEEEIDEELMEWIREAYWFSATK